ncbi:MAG: preprotein translocase subunit SecG [Cyclobacteriaceae bacterium]
MYTVVVTLIIITALLLVLVVLAQNPKGGGLSSQFGGSGSAQVMGVKKTGDILEKLTWGFAIGLLALTLSTNLLIDTNQSDSILSPNIESAQDQAIIPSQNIQSDDSGLDDLGLEESSDSLN